MLKNNQNMVVENGFDIAGVASSILATPTIFCLVSKPEIDPGIPLTANFLRNRRQVIAQEFVRILSIIPWGRRDYLVAGSDGRLVFGGSLTGRLSIKKS